MPGVSPEAQFVDGTTKKVSRRLQESAFGIDSVLRDDLATVWHECQVPNWDGFNAVAVERDTLRNTYKFLESVPLGFAAPSVSAEPDGHMTLEWYRSPERTLSVSVSPDDEIHYAAVLGASRKGGMEPFFGEIPDVVLNLIREIGPC